MYKSDLPHYLQTWYVVFCLFCFVFIFVKKMKTGMTFKVMASVVIEIFVVFYDKFLEAFPEVTGKSWCLSQELECLQEDEEIMKAVTIMR